MFHVDLLSLEMQSAKSARNTSMDRKSHPTSRIPMCNPIEAKLKMRTLLGARYWASYTTQLPVLCPVLLMVGLSSR
jgi:hypothetical protein